MQSAEWLMGCSACLMVIDVADDLSALLAAEEAKRNRHVSDEDRRRMIEQAIAWAEMQQTVRRNTKEACLREQARLLAAIKAAGERG